MDGGGEWPTRDWEGGGTEGRGVGQGSGNSPSGERVRGRRSTGPVPPPAPHPRFPHHLKGPMNSPKPPTQRTALRFPTHCHLLLLILLAASRGGQGRVFLPLNNEETGTKRWRDFSKVTQLLSGGDRSLLGHMERRGGGAAGGPRTGHKYDGLLVAPFSPFSPPSLLQTLVRALSLRVYV